MGQVFNLPASSQFRSLETCVTASYRECRDSDSTIAFLRKQARLRGGSLLHNALKKEEGSM